MKIRDKFLSLHKQSKKETPAGKIKSMFTRQKKSQLVTINHWSLEIHCYKVWFNDCNWTTRTQQEQVAREDDANEKDYERKISTIG